MQHASTFEPKWLAYGGLAGVASLSATFVALMKATDYKIWGAVVVAPLLIAVTLPILKKVADEDEEGGLFALLTIALCLKLIGAIARYFVAFHLYAAADASTYHRSGANLASAFRSGHFNIPYEGLIGTDSIRVLTGLIYSITGPTLVGGYLVYSWLGFLGLLLFYRAYVLAVPEGRSRSYARLLFFLPSALFWPSGMGKEAWMMLGLGAMAFGAAKVFSHRPIGGGALLLAGGAAAGVVRPHMAAMVGLAALAGYLFYTPPPSLRELRPVVKGASLAILIALALVTLAGTARFLAKVDFAQGISSTLESTADATSKGGSSFDAPTATSPARIPLAAWTVLFRPHPLEADTPQTLVTALETSFLFGLTIIRIRSVAAVLRAVHRRPYFTFAVVYTGMFIIAFSSFGNFGLLARERVQLLPIFLIFLTIPTLRRPHGAHAPT